MEMDVDKSDDELELERLVFGDSEGLKERLKGKNEAEKTSLRTDLEDFEDDQVLDTFRQHANASYSSLTPEHHKMSPKKTKEPLKTMTRISLSRGLSGMTATTRH